MDEYKTALLHYLIGFILKLLQIARNFCRLV